MSERVSECMPILGLPFHPKFPLFFSCLLHTDKGIHPHLCLFGCLLSLPSSSTSFVLHSLAPTPSHIQTNNQPKKQNRHAHLFNARAKRCSLCLVILLHAVVGHCESDELRDATKGEVKLQLFCDASVVLAHIHCIECTLQPQSRVLVSK